MVTLIITCLIILVIGAWLIIKQVKNIIINAYLCFVFILFVSIIVYGYS